MSYRVAVTGVGVVTPIGIGVRAFWTNLLAGDVGVRSIRCFDPGAFSSRIAAEVRDFDARDFMAARRVQRTERFAQFAVSAARLAVDDAAFPLDGARHDIGVFVGSALGGLAFAEEQHDRYRRGGIRAVKPLLAVSVFAGAATTNIALDLDLRGPTLANANSCAAGSVAIGEAFRAIRRGECRAALAGGVEAPLSPLVFGAFAVIRSMSTRNDEPARASRPFDRDRDGFVMAEGAGVLVLERMDDALRRDARIYGEVAGYGLTTDAYHMTAPRPDGTCLARAIDGALAEANMDACEVELVDAHGSATVLNDKTETIALERALGSRARTVPVTATKGQHGHALGATGAWEAAVALLALQDGRVPRVVNLENRDDACALACVDATKPLDPANAVSTSAGFGGINAALVFRRAEG